MKTHINEILAFNIPENIKGCDVQQRPVNNQLERLSSSAIKVKRSRSSAAVFMKVPITLQPGTVTVSCKYYDEDNILKKCYCQFLYCDILFGNDIYHALDYSILAPSVTPKEQGSEMKFSVTITRPGRYYLSLEREGTSATNSTNDLQTIFYDIKITQLVKVKTSIGKKPNEEALSIPIKKGSSIDRVGVSISYDENGVWRLSGKATSTNYFSVFDLNNADRNKAFPGEFKHRKIKLIVEGVDAPTVSLFGIGPRGQYGWQKFTDKDIELTKLYFRINVTNGVTYNSTFTIKVVYDDELEPVCYDIQKAPENILLSWLKTIPNFENRVVEVDGKKCLYLNRHTDLPPKMIPYNTTNILFKYKAATLHNTSWASMLRKKYWDSQETERFFLDCNQNNWVEWFWNPYKSEQKPRVFDLYCEGVNYPVYIDLEESGIWINDKQLGKTNG